MTFTTPRPSLFEQEMHDQIEAAQAAVAEAARRGDPLLEQASRNNLDSLVSLARRNGIVVELSDLPGQLSLSAAEPTLI
jgi:UDP-N-acetylglucosamine enolpyruvyl transferase